VYKAISLHTSILPTCHSNETHAPIANPPNSAQLEGPPTIPPIYIWVYAVVWECGEGQTEGGVRQTWEVGSACLKEDVSQIEFE